MAITKSISKVFIPNFYVFLQIKEKKHIEWDFVLTPRSCQGMGLGRRGCPKSQNFIFSNMVMWHIKLTVIMSRIECKFNFHPRVKL